MTDLQQKIFVQIILGFSSKEIASKLSLAYQTVRNETSKILHRYNKKSVHELTAHYYLYMDQF